MERGLLWLPLLAVFIGLAWAGWHEYQKVEAYQQWAKQFERSKYDVYAALGQVDRTLTWGIPTRQGPTQLKTVDFSAIEQVTLTIADQPISDPMITSLENRKGRVALALTLKNGACEAIPFTELEIAQQWLQYLAPHLTQP